MSSTKTGIEWTDATWNPMTGCTQISAGCDHCYALLVAETKTRAVYLKQPPVRDTAESRIRPFAPRFWERRLDQPLRWRKPMRIFVNSMSDVFHAQFTQRQIQRVFEVMVRADWHQFQVLTKRPERALRLASDLPWAPNIWIGTSIENMSVAKRADSLRQIAQAAVRFISAEPLLGSLAELNLAGIDWIGAARGPQTQCEIAFAGPRDRCVQERVVFLEAGAEGHQRLGPRVEGVLE
jgi:protein gp37